ncbi:MAG TPA: hypothetical protein PL064_00195, partial [Thermogutta sp.]|nr:hypothetical protein [Thermogutta sp.]
MVNDLQHEDNRKDDVATTDVGAPAPTRKRLNFFERYLSVWVALCMVAGVILGKSLPDLTATLRTWEFASGSQI